MTTKTPPHVRHLKRLGACPPAIEWAATMPSMAAVWRECDRGDWMMWLLGRLSGPPGSPSRRRLALAAVECARLVEHRDASGAALAGNDMVEGYALRVPGITLDDVRAAADVATYAAAYAVVADARTYAASGSAARSACYADAADAAYAASASVAIADADARTATLATCADIVRRHYPRAPRITKREDT